MSEEQKPDNISKHLSCEGCTYDNYCIWQETDEVYKCNYVREYEQEIINED